MWFGNETGTDLMSLEHLPLVEDLESIDPLCPLHLHHLGVSKVKWMERDECIAEYTLCVGEELKILTAWI